MLQVVDDSKVYVKKSATDEFGKLQEFQVSLEASPDPNYCLRKRALFQRVDERPGGAVFTSTVLFLQNKQGDVGFSSIQDFKSSIGEAISRNVLYTSIEDFEEMKKIALEWFEK